ncbi:MAG: hypothetical protein HFG88_04970 [Dorea sp.]|nr:hypothetical protein [Dorea sp.]
MRTKNSVYNVIIGFLYILVHSFSSFIITNLILSSFGSEINGLISSAKQILSYASLIEGGLGAACIVSYYKPLANNDIKIIKSIFNESGKFYKRIGFIYSIFLLGCCILFPTFIYTSIGKVYTSFVLFFTGFSQCLQYLFLEQYQSLIIADQKNRVVQLITSVGELANILLVALSIKVFGIGDIIFIQSINIICVIIKIALCHLYFRKHYYEIYKCQTKERYKGVIQQQSASFIHVIASQISFSTDIVVLTIFRTLEEVSIYSIYNLICNFISYIFNVLANSVSSSFGDLYNKKKELFVERFRSYETVSIMINSIVTISIFCVLKGFIILYTHRSDDVEYWNLMYSIFFIFIAYLNNLRTPHAAMIRASGNFEKTKYYFLGEAFINLLISLSLVQRYGICGVLIGTLFSVIFRDYFVIQFIYKQVIQIDIKKFLEVSLPNMIVTIVMSVIGLCFSIEFGSYIEFVFVGSICMIFSSFIIFMVNYIFNQNNFMQVIIFLKGIKSSMLSKHLD